MNHVTHSLGGAAGWLAGCWVAGAPGGVVLAGSVLAFTAAPLNDIDNLGSWSRRAKRGLIRRRRRGRTTYKLQLIRWRKHPIKSRVAWGVSRLGRHREGPCHSLIVCAAIGLLLAGLHLFAPWWPWWAGLAIGCGLVSHILLDLANERPVRAFWPWPWMGAAGLMSVGHAGEKWLARPALVLAVAGLGWLTVKGYR